MQFTAAVNLISHHHLSRVFRQWQGPCVCLSVCSSVTSAVEQTPRLCSGRGVDATKGVMDVSSFVKNFPRVKFVLAVMAYLWRSYMLYACFNNNNNNNDDDIYKQRSLK